ncbi:MAG TPA: hypothetical protein VLK33_22925 [Terriglobales bacterium]|nr:hypothetical protein [Terriglobales bacterium]
MQHRPPQNQTVHLSLADLLRGVESIELDGFNGKLIIHIEAIHIELHLSGSEPQSDGQAVDNLNGHEGG